MAVVVVDSSDVTRLTDFSFSFFQHINPLMKIIGALSSDARILLNPIPLALFNAFD